MTIPPSAAVLPPYTEPAVQVATLSPWTQATRMATMIFRGWRVCGNLPRPGTPHRLHSACPDHNSGAVGRGRRILHLPAPHCAEEVHRLPELQEQDQAELPRQGVNRNSCCYMTVK